MVDPTATHHGKQQQRHADQRRFQHAAGANVAHVNADQHGDGYGRKHRRCCPRAVLHGVDDHQAQHRDENDDDGERADQRGKPADGPQLVARHLAQAFAVAARGEKHRHHVLHAAAQHRADQDPEGAGQITKLRRKRRADQRSGARDGGEVMTKHHPAVGRHEVTAVVETLGGRGAGCIRNQDFCHDPRAVKTIADGIGAHGRDYEPHRVDALAAMDGNTANGGRADNCNHQPD